MALIKIKPSHPSQGEFVLIEEDDFDPAKHEKLGESKPAQDAQIQPARGRGAKAAK